MRKCAKNADFDEPVFLPAAFGVSDKGVRRKIKKNSGTEKDNG